MTLQRVIMLCLQNEGSFSIQCYSMRLSLLVTKIRGSSIKGRPASISESKAAQWLRHWNQ